MFGDEIFLKNCHLIILSLLLNMNKIPKKSIPGQKGPAPTTHEGSGYVVITQLGLGMVPPFCKDKYAPPTRNRSPYL